MSTPPIQYSGPKVSEKVDWEIRRHLQLAYQKLANHTQAFALLQKKIDSLQVTVSGAGGGGGGGGSSVGVSGTYPIVVTPLNPPNVSLAITDGNILVGDASNLAQDIPMSGDVSILDTGATTVIAWENQPLDAATMGAPALNDVPKWDGAKWIAAVSTSLVVASTAFTAAGMDGAGNFTVAHGLGYSPSFAVIACTVLGIVVWQSPLRWDATNFYLTASDASMAGFVDSIQ